MKKIDKRDIDTILALTPTQEGMLFHYLKTPGGDQYVEQLCLNLSGPLEMERFEKAWDLVVETNDMLRTLFHWEKLEKPTQIVLKKQKCLLYHHDLSSKNDHQKKAALEEIKTADRRQGFDLTQVPFRVICCKLAEHTYQVIISNHHILYDGWSTGIVLKEFFTYYETLGEYPSVQKITPEVKTPFKEFIQWLREQDEKEQKQYWQHYLAGIDTPTLLSPKKRKDDSAAPSTGKYALTLPAGIDSRIDEFLKNHRCTLAALLYTSWGILLQRYGNSEDIVFGTTVSGRSAKIKGIEDMIGMFINTIPLRLNPHPGETILAVLKHINDTLRYREAYEHASLVKIRAASQLAPGEELFDTIVVIENYPLDAALNSEGNNTLRVTSFSAIEVTNYPLTVGILLSNELMVNFLYDQELFSEAYIEKLALHFTHILSEILENPGKQLCEIDILSHEERQQVLVTFNDTGSERINNKTLQEAFLEQVERTPEHIALVDGDTHLTYRALKLKSAQLAHFLDRQEGKTGELLGIMVQRTRHMITGILGILLAGRGYVPINPKTPLSRTRYILEECNIRLLLTDSRAVDLPPDITTVDLAEQIVYPETQFNHPSVSADTLAYIIFTSGSTGNPKGVPITHANLMPLLRWGNRSLALGTGDRVVQNLSYYFDWSVWEIFITLTSGASLYMIPEETVLNSGRYVEFMKLHHITVLHIPPTQFQSLVQWGEKLDTLKYLCIGAEKLTLDLVKRSTELVHEDCRLFNMYGPTEATIIAAVLEIKREKLIDYIELSSVPIGNAVGNTFLLILNRDLHLCPIHVPGELYIGGEALARGYLNNPELTAEKFYRRRPGSGYTQNLPPWTNRNRYVIPHSPTRLLTYAPIYKTGDRARWLPDGTVEFLGRIDFQIKIRGYRIEPGEIEKHLLEHNLVDEALVMARESKSGEKYLCAYIVPSSATGFNLSAPTNSPPPHLVTQLKKHLAQRLPDYMIPAHFVPLEKIPLNPNGKADTKALPEPVITSYRGYAAPTDKTEKRLVEIWSQVLGIPVNRVGIDDDFFELGGHSLKATALISRIHKVFNIEIPLKAIFETPTIREIARTLKQVGKTQYSSILPVEKKEYYSLSSAQKRLFILQKMEPRYTHYNISGAVHIEGDLRGDKPEDCFRELVTRHESLRTSFFIMADEIVQQVHPEAHIEVEKYDTGKQESIDHPQLTGFMRRFIRPFDLSRPPLLRVGIIETAAREYVLMVDMHHIISDGTSIEILSREFMTLYGKDALPPLRIQYKDYSQWQQGEKQRQLIRRQETFWLNRYPAEVPVLQLPTDYPRPAVQSFSGKTVPFLLEDETVTAIRNIARTDGTTVFMVVLSLYTILLSRLSGQEDIVIGTPVAGRGHSDLSGVIGMFVNTLPLRNYPSPGKSFSRLLAEVKENTLNDFENQDYPFDDLVERVEVNRDASRNPMFDVMLVFRNMEQAQLRLPGMSLKKIPYQSDTSKFDITLSVDEDQEGTQLNFRITYNTSLYVEQTIRRYIETFKRIAVNAVNEPGTDPERWDILSEAEKKQLVLDFNDTDREIPHVETLHGVFARQVEKTPDNIAAAAREHNGYPLPVAIQVTYKKLHQKAGQLSYLLQEKGITPDSPVGLMAERSVGMITGILAILKAGGAYLPIDPEAPQERIDFILSDSGVNIVLSDRKHVGTGHFPILVLDLVKLNDPGNLGNRLACSEDLAANPSNLAYIIYTSGSSGRPKGVMVRHRNVINLLVGLKERIYNRYNRYLNVALLAPVIFDASVKQIFGALLQGHALYIVPGTTRSDSRLLRGFYARHQIDISDGTPAHLYILAEHDISIQQDSPENSLPPMHFIVGGDALSVEIVQRFYRHLQQKNRPKMTNIYGPTECTVDSSSFDLPLETLESYRKIPIGKPFPNHYLYIINSSATLQPVGVPGELVIGGAGVARGYLNNPELTAEKFVLSSYKLYRSYTSYMSYRTHNHHVLYRTGDLARWLPDGNVEFLGRIDRQLKIRGNRIEPEEIENRLLKFAKIKEAVVISQQNRDLDHYLIAYIVGETDIDINKLKSHLSITLPGYMIPAAIMPLEKIPLTPNGKVNRKQLPQPEIKSGENVVPPRNPLEEKLAALWAGVLGKDVVPAKSIGIDDNFFSQGGNSLTAIILLSRIDKEIRVRIPLGEIFREPTIRGMANYIDSIRGIPGIHGTHGGKESGYSAVQPIEKREYYSLSSAQKRMYILQYMDGIKTGYNMPYSAVIRGEIDGAALEAAFSQLIPRHESLRTSFEMLNNEPVQRIHDRVDFKIEYIKPTGNTKSTSHSPEAHVNTQPPENLLKHFIRPFDLSGAPLLRAGIMPTCHREAIFMVDMHHIIADGVSRQLLVKEFMALMAHETLPPLKLQYKDFAQWQNHRKKQTGLKPQREFWHKELSGDIPVLELPTDFPRPEVQSFVGDQLTFEISAAEVQAMKKLAQARGTTLFMVILAAYYILLSKLSTQEDILVGTPTMGRNHADIEPIIGMFVNTLVLRNYPAGEKTFGDFLQEVKERSLLAFENQEYQYEELVEELDVVRDAGRNPLFDTMFALLNLEMSVLEIPGLTLTPQENQVESAKFDLTFKAMETADKLGCSFDYSNQLFTRSSIERYIAYLKIILAVVLENPGTAISAIEVVSEEEKQLLLVELNRTTVEPPPYETIPQGYARQALQTPDHIAVVGEISGTTSLEPAQKPGSLTYRELDERAGNLAGLLSGKGVTPDAIVGIMIERTLEMIIGIMGILKSGAAYLPIDPGYPGERIDYMLADSGAQLLVTAETVTAAYNMPHTSYISPPTDETHYPSGGSLAYIIYTSGSTGKPKGVLVEHRSVVNLIHTQQKRFGIDMSDRILQFSTMCFDASVEQICIALLSGAVSVLIDKRTLLEPDRFSVHVIRQRITHIHAVPSFLSQIALNDTTQIKRILSGGDVCPPSLAQKWATACDFYNRYGPTETTVTSMVMLIKSPDETGTSVPIGKPIGNTHVYLFDRWLNLVPPGVVGELTIGGAGVTRGYLNRPELTAEKFIFSPHKYYRSYTSYMSYKLYKTGDLARWLPGGNMEFRGRVDNQVKIRGNRIEPGEIENRLAANKTVAGAVVAVHRDAENNNYLCAYVVPSPGHPFNPEELKNQLSQTLPDYMIPTFFLQVDRIPLTPIGKIDRKALPKPKLTVGKGYAPPRNHLEKQLAEMWWDVLGKDTLAQPPGIDDNFFRIGGHSLKATVLGTRIYKTLGVKVSLGEIFKNPTIRGLSRVIDASGKERYEAVEHAEKREYYPLSSAQKRLVVLHRLSGSGTGYNITSLLTLAGAVDNERLTTSFRKLIDRHESFRTSITVIDEEYKQKIHDRVEFSIAILNHEPAENDQPITPGVITPFVRSFDLMQAPLLRVGLVNIHHHPRLLIVDMHHIIADGYSMNIVIADFMSYYNNELPPEPIRFSYKDYALWQESPKARIALKRQEEYWLNEFRGEIPVLELPGDYKRPAIQDFAGSRLNFKIEKQETELLRALAIETESTLFMVLLAALNLLLAKLGGQEEIVVGVPVAGRRHADLLQIIGVFINTLPLKSSPKGEISFKEFLKEIREKTLTAFENQDYPFEDLVEKLAITRNPGRNPLFDIMFTLQGVETARLNENTSAIKLTPYVYDLKTSKFDMTFVVQEVGDRLNVSVEYSTRLYKEETILRYCEYYQRLITAITRAPEARISHLEILSPRERNQLIIEFNREDEEFPVETTSFKLFTRHVEMNPDQIALVGEAPAQENGHAVSGAAQPSNNPHSSHTSYWSHTSYMSYKKLYEISLRLGRYLLARGEKPGGLIGLLVERTMEMIISILAAWSVGCGYVPLNPKAPWARNRYILEECRVRVLITHVRSNEVLPEFEVIDPAKPGDYSQEGSTQARSSIPNRDQSPAPVTSPAYVIFTSGSTGKPKGVPITHANFTPLLHWGYKYLPLSTQDRSAQNLSYYFDWSVWEIFITLTSGATLYIIKEDILLNALEYLAFIRRNQITTLHITPTQFQSLINWAEGVRPLETLRYLAIGAEKLTTNLVKRTLPLLSPECRVYNMYGPTEATIMSAVLEIDRANVENYRELTSVPIGKPTANLDLLILDRNMNVVPLCVVGELFISGKGVAAGYLNNVELTSEKFIFSPHKYYRSYTSYMSSSAYMAYNSKKLYKTGDLARWHRDGTVEFLGRVDFQVKIRGYRIELGEIENRLLSHDRVKDAVVIDKDTGDEEKVLCAYIVPVTSGSGEEQASFIADLKNYLARELPDYMIPASYAIIASIPLNPNGKVDRAALPEPEIAVGEAYTAPRNSLEKKLQEIWQELLKLEKIGIHDDFFTIGGHSLKMLNLINAIEKKIQVKIDIQDFFQAPTIAGLAELIRQGKTVFYESIQPQPPREYYELSYPQKRLWMLYQLEPDNPAFNLPSRITLDEAVEEANVRKVFEKLVQRHESFRTYFKNLKGNVVQIIQVQTPLKLEVHDLAGMPEPDRAEKREQLFREESRKPFVLENPPLFRTKLIRCGPSEFDVILTMHHIITDGWSMELLGNEFRKLYEAYKSGSETDLELLRHRYIDYVYWHERLLADREQMQKAKEFWETQLKGDNPTLDLPYNTPRKNLGSKKSAAYRIVIPETILLGLKDLAKQQKASLFMVLLAGFNVLLYRVTGQSDILLGIPGAARQHEDLKNIVGFFVNTLILRNTIETREPFTQLLARVQENMLKVLEYQSFPLELLCSEYKIKYPELSVFFNLLTFGDSSRQNLENTSATSATSAGHIPEVQDAKFDLTCYLEEYKNGMTISTHYYTELFKPQSIEKMMHIYLTVLENISREPGKKINEYTTGIPGKKRPLKAW